MPRPQGGPTGLAIRQVSGGSRGAVVGKWLFGVDGLALPEALYIVTQHPPGDYVHCQVVHRDQ